MLPCNTVLEFLGKNKSNDQKMKFTSL